MTDFAKEIAEIEGMIPKTAKDLANMRFRKYKKLHPDTKKKKTDPMFSGKTTSGKDVHSGDHSGDSSGDSSGG